MNVRLTRHKFTILLLSIACMTTFSGYSTASEEDFEISGMMRSGVDNARVPQTAVTFEAEGFRQTFYTNAEGSYKGRLPAGLYSMMAVPREEGLESYRRPIFEGRPSSKVVLNGILFSKESSCDLGVLPSSHHVPDDNDRKNDCGGIELFSVPSNVKAPLELLIRYRSRRASPDGGYIYANGWDSGPSTVYRNGSDPHKFKIPVFVAYDLFSLWADQVTYDFHTQTLHAIDNVVMMTGQGETIRAAEVKVKISNGSATLLP
jgi:hypothetical protein